MIVKCKYCWEDFLKKTYNQLSCKSDWCKKIAKGIIARKDYEKHKERCLLNAKKLRYTLNCKECWKEFKSYSKELLLCSKECQSIWLKRDRIWEKNPAYRNWLYTKESDKKIHRDRNNLFYRMCQKMNIEMQENYWYRFCEYCWINNSLRWEHHHIIFRSEKPLHQFLHDKRNTIHLCVKCHNIFHKDKSIRIPLIRERKLNELFWDEILFL